MSVPKTDPHVNRATNEVRFQVIMAKMSVFWDVAPCSLVEVDTLMMEVVSTSETSVNFCQTRRRKILEDGHLQSDEYFLQVY
jgi:hypothetical protein